MLLPSGPAKPAPCIEVYLDVDNEEKRRVGPRLQERHPVLHPPVSADVVNPEQMVSEERNAHNVTGGSAKGFVWEGG